VVLFETRKPENNTELCQQLLPAVKDRFVSGYQKIQERFLNILFWNNTIAATPQVIEESAILKTGLKNTNDSPGLNGDQ